jgi:GT2 family glycosyltransferase
LEGECVDDLTAVIVTHNSAGHLAPCLDAVRRWTLKTIVVDNASTDATLAEAGAATEVIRNHANRGFAAAANQGFAAAETGFVLLLNPDVEVEDGVAALADAAADGAASGLLVDWDGQPQAGFTLRRFPTPAALAFEALGVNRLFPWNPVNRRYRCLDLDLRKPSEVEQPPGAFLLVRRDAWVAIGGFDEGFAPVWFEDVDFCLRLRKAGWRLRYTPAARARHRGGHSIRRMTPVEREVQWYVSLLRYAGKHFGAGGYHAVCLSVALSSFPRAFLGVLRTGRVERLQAGIRIAAEAVRRFRGPRPARASAMPALAGETFRETD